MPELDSEVTKKMTVLEEIRNTQLNEKVSENTYQIVHPETNVNQVITNPSKRFVSDAEKALWNKIAANNTASLQYRGAWTSNVTYKKYDVVYVERTVSSTVDASTTEITDTSFFVFIGDEPLLSNSTNRPVYSLSQSISGNWMSIDYNAYLAHRAQSVRTIDVKDSTQKKLLAVVSGNASAGDYRTVSYDSDLSYVPSTNTLTAPKIKSEQVTADKFVGNLDGEADRAINYVTYERDADGNKVENGTKGKAEIDAAITGINRRIDAITDGTGGAVLGNKLTITKDGENAVQFDGSKPISVDIKQTFTPDEISGLLDEQKKIFNKWLPDSILGQLRYIGVWNPNVQNNGVTSTKGDYYIATHTGNYAPDGTLMNTSASALPHYFQIGDWAVYNGSTWDKVDNTDAVTMVNHRIGAVEIYQTWSAATQYYRGDIVKIDDVLYICNTEHQSATSFDDPTTAGYWDIFGRNYTAEDGIKIDGTVIKHDTSKPTVLNTETTLNSGQSFNALSINTDDFGHLTSISVNKVTLGTDFIDTVRPIQVDDNVVFDESTKTALNFKSNNLIKVKYENNSLNIEHANNQGGLGEINPDKVTVSSTTDKVLYPGQGFTVPKFNYDGAGHIQSGGTVTFRIADTLVKHKHFDIIKDTDGSQLIKAYDTLDVSDANNALKFYLGNAVQPTNETQMNFNGIFNATKILQQGNKVTDTSNGTYFGKNYAGEDLVSVYNETTKKFDAPDTGVVAGVYSAVSVNTKGIVNAAGHIIEFGTAEDADPSDSLVIGGLFFRLHNTNDANA